MRIPIINEEFAILKHGWIFKVKRRSRREL
jgi:hypothetical protein